MLLSARFVRRHSHRSRLTMRGVHRGSMNGPPDPITISTGVMSTKVTLHLDQAVSLPLAVTLSLTINKSWL